MLLLFPPALIQQGPENPAQLADFDQAFAWLKANYAWGERVEWDLLRDEFRPKAGAAANPEAFQRVMEALLDQFADGGTRLVCVRSEWRPTPGDIGAEWQDPDAVILSVRPGSVAAGAGLRPGMKILGVGGKALNQALEVRRPSFLKGQEEENRHWMLNSLLAGREGEAVRLRVQEGGKTLDFTIPAGEGAASLPETKLLPGDYAYLAIPDFDSEAAVKRVDEAVDRFPQAKGWVLDLRDTHSGDPAVMKSALGRFFAKKMRFALNRKRDGEGLGAAVEDAMTPRGKAFEGPLALLVSPRTAGAAEGAAMAVQGTLRGFAFGTRTAGVGATTKTLQLKHSGLKLQASTEAAYDLFMRPRFALRPRILVDLSVEKGPDPVLAAALAWMGTVAGKR